MALLAGSPAAGAGAIVNDSSNNPITVDQRGNTRFAAAADIGAFQSVTVAGIDRSNPATSPTSANSVTFTVTFNEPVSNADTGDFMVNAGSVNSISPVSTAIYHVTVNGLNAFTGTLTLDFAASPTITDAVGNPLLNTTPTGANVNTYVIDHTSPAFTSANSHTFTAGVFGTFTVAVSSFLPATLSESITDVLPS